MSISRYVIHFCTIFSSYINTEFYQGAAKNWESTKKWHPLYLREIMGSEIITVAETPNGYVWLIKPVLKIYIYLGYSAGGTDIKAC